MIGEQPERQPVGVESNLLLSGPAAGVERRRVCPGPGFVVLGIDRVHRQQSLDRHDSEHHRLVPQRCGVVTLVLPEGSWLHPTHLTASAEYM